MMSVLSPEPNVLGPGSDKIRDDEESNVQKPDALNFAAVSADTSLFARLGGEPAVDAVVELLYTKIQADDRVKNLFEGNMDQLAAHQKQFLTFVFGGPNHYGERLSGFSDDEASLTREVCRRDSHDSINTFNSAKLKNSLRAVHSRVNDGVFPTKQHFEAVSECLLDTMRELNVSTELIDEVVLMLLSVKNEILGNKGH